MRSPRPIVYTLPMNRAGRDYLVGDIHGCFSKLEAALDEMSFDRSRDRLIACGDLVDRGPESPAALKWLAQPWFKSVRGNHESMFLRWYASQEEAGEDDFKALYLHRNGGLWVESCDPGVLDALAVALARLPLAVVVPQCDGRAVGVVHAELPAGCSWSELASATDDAEDIVHSLQWGRDRLAAACKGDESVYAGVPGIDAVFAGHTPLRKPVALGNCLFADTVGWGGGQFTIVSAQDMLDVIGQPQLAL